MVVESSDPPNHPQQADCPEIVVDDYGFEIDPQFGPEFRAFKKRFAETRNTNLREWNRFLRTTALQKEVGTPDYLLAKPSLFKNTDECRDLVRKGIPLERRPRLWMILSGAEEKKNRHSSGYYQKLLKKHEGQLNASIENVERDLERTFPAHPLFRSKEGLKSLRQILVAYSWRNQNIGYCQSMNFLCAMLIVVVKDEESVFWLLAHTVENMLPDYYGNDLVGVQVDQRVLDDVFSSVLPEMHAYMEKYGVSVSLIGFQWFMCIFVNQFPTETVLRIWDCFFLEGVSVLFRVSLAVLKMNESFILQGFKSLGSAMLLEDDTVDLIGRIKLVTAGTFDADKLLTSAFNESLFNLEGEELASIRQEYRRRIDHEVQEAKQRLEILQLQRLTRMDSSLLETLQEQFQTMKGEDGGINRQEFDIMFKRIAASMFGAQMPMDGLFRFLDVNDDDVLDFREIVCGLSILSQGSVEEKLRMCFNVFDRNSDGYIHKHEMFTMINSIYKLFYEGDYSGHATAFLEFVFDKERVLEDGLDREKFCICMHMQPLIIHCFHDPSLQEKPKVDGSLPHGAPALHLPKESKVIMTPQSPPSSALDGVFDESLDLSPRQILTDISLTCPNGTSSSTPPGDPGIIPTSQPGRTNSFLAPVQDSAVELTADQLSQGVTVFNGSSNHGRPLTGRRHSETLSAKPPKRRNECGINLCKTQ